MYGDINYRYENYGKPNSILPSYVITGNLEQYGDHFSDVLLMTGASENHGWGSFNLLYSILLTEPYTSILYIDLGISKYHISNRFVIFFLVVVFLGGRWIIE